MVKKAFEARVKDDYRMATVTAFGGREFVKGVWRPVPGEQVVSAEAHPFLEVREVGGASPGGETVTSAAPPGGEADTSPPRGERPSATPAGGVSAVDVVDKAAASAPPRGARRGKL